MPERVYVGPAPAVEIPAAEGGFMVCENGKTVDVAPEVVAGLDASGDWRKPKGKSAAASGGKE